MGLRRRSLLVRWVRWVSPALLVTGTGLVLAAVASGGAHLFLVLIIPVVTGGTWELGLGVLFLLLGFFTLPLVFTANVESERAQPIPPTRKKSATEPSGPSSASPENSGGLILIGPVPLFFGTWRHRPPIPYWVAALLGAAILGILLFVFLF